MDNSYHIYFSNHHLERWRDLELPAIIFSPSPDTWNDFSFRTRFTYEAYDRQRQRTPGEVHLAFLGQNTDLSSSDQVERVLSRAKTHILAAKEFPPFYTMHHDMRAYREIVKKCGPEVAEEVLLAMNDLVAVKRAGKLPEWFSEATSSRQFALAFMRSAETFFAYHNAGSILNGLEQESLSGISINLRLVFHLPAFRNPHDLNFKFEYDTELPKRIAVVIGKNGVGKSQSLAHIAKSLLSDDRRFRDQKGEKPSVNRLLAVSSPGETRNTFPGPRKRARIDYRRVFLTRNSYGDKLSGLGTALIRLVRASGERIKTKTRWTLFCESVSVVAPLEELVVKLRENAQSSTTSRFEEHLSLSMMQDGGEQQRLERWAVVDASADIYRSINGDVFPLSSGQLTFIRFAAQACLHIENGTLVLVDEPETHLHPNFISDFVRLLDKLLAETGSLAILATHSPYLVREVSRSQVVVLREGKDRTVEVLKPRLKTLGADVGEISHFVFQDADLGTLLGSVRDRMTKNPAQAQWLLKALEEELSVEAWMSLKQELRET